MIVHFARQEAVISVTNELAWELRNLSVFHSTQLYCVTSESYAAFLGPHFFLYGGGLLFF